MSPITINPPSVLSREAQFRRLYLECFPAVASYVSRSGGNLETARDVFQEALLRYYEKTEIEGFVPRSGGNAYLIGIARNVFLKSLERSLETVPLEGMDYSPPVVTQPVPEKLMHYLEQAGKRCMDLLSAFYYQKLSMKGLAQQFGYATERSATVQKYKCLEKVRETIKERALDYEDFTD